MITIKRLRELFHLELYTGKLFWKIKPSLNTNIGDEAGGLNAQGYRTVMINDKTYRVHRLIWAMYYGRWPKNELDHIDGVRNNNVLSNLREATRTQNQHNRKDSKNNTSGYRGVIWNKRMGKWQTQIRVNDKLKHLGYFTCLEDAAKAYVEAKVIYHPFSPTVRRG